jgi:hypothetical protein
MAGVGRVETDPDVGNSKTRNEWMIGSQSALTATGQLLLAYAEGRTQDAAPSDKSCVATIGWVETISAQSRIYGIISHHWNDAGAALVPMGSIRSIPPPYFLQLVMQGRARFKRLSATSLVFFRATLPLCHLANSLAISKPFVGFDGFGQRRGVLPMPSADGITPDAKGVAVGGVAQFADVAGPVEGHQAAQVFRSQHRRRTVVAFGRL